MSSINISVAFPDRWVWWVYRLDGETLIMADYAATAEQAFRNARNFIKRNQNLVFGD